MARSKWGVYGKDIVSPFDLENAKALLCQIPMEHWLVWV